jgi:hypothetical protein
VEPRHAELAVAHESRAAEVEAPNPSGRRESAA